MRPLFGRVVLNEPPAPPGVGPTAAAESLQRAVLSAIDWALQHEPAE